MTTTIMILAHAWPVLVTAIDHLPVVDGSDAETIETELMTIEPGKHANSYITSTRELRITEMAMPVQAGDTFLDRLGREYADLADRFARLGKFIGTAAFFALPDDSQDDLKFQFKAMEDYEGILAKRLAALTPPT